MTKFEKILQDDQGYVSNLDYSFDYQSFRLQYYSPKMELSMVVEASTLRKLFAKFVKRYKESYRHHVLADFENKCAKAVTKVNYAKLEKCRNIKKSKSSPESSV